MSARKKMKAGQKQEKRKSGACAIKQGVLGTKVAVFDICNNNNVLDSKKTFFAAKQIVKG